MIDTLAYGFEVINRHIWILLLPLALDLCLWLGPQLSPQPALQQVLDAYQAMAARAATLDGGLGPDAADLAPPELATLAGQFNLLSVLAFNFVAAVPSLLLNQPVLARGGTRIEIGNPGTVIGLVCLLEVVGLWLGALYYGYIGRQVRDGETTLGGVVRAAFGYWWCFLQIVLLVVAVVVAAGLVGGLVVALGYAIAPALGELALGVIGIGIRFAVLFAGVSFYFAKDAVVISDAGPTEALSASAGIVRRHIWPALGLILLIHLIGWGFQPIWESLARLAGTAGIVIGIVGNAYLWSGAAGATMRFYNARVIDLPGVLRLKRRGLR